MIYMMKLSCPSLWHVSDLNMIQTHWPGHLRADVSALNKLAVHHNLWTLKPTQFWCLNINKWWLGVKWIFIRFSWSWISRLRASTTTVTWPSSIIMNFEWRWNIEKGFACRAAACHLMVDGSHKLFDKLRCYYFGCTIHFSVSDDPNSTIPPRLSMSSPLPSFPSLDSHCWKMLRGPLEAPVTAPRHLPMVMVTT